MTMTDVWWIYRKDETPMIGEHWFVHGGEGDEPRLRKLVAAGDLEACRFSLGVDGYWRRELRDVEHRSSSSVLVSAVELTESTIADFVQRWNDSGITAPTPTTNSRFRTWVLAAQQKIADRQNKPLMDGLNNE